MKSIQIFFLIIFFTYPLAGQDTINNFYAENNEIMWVKVFSDSSLTFNKLVDRIKSSGLLVNIDISEDKITGNSKEIDADFKGAGYSEMLTPMYISRSHVNGFLIIEYKENKYRVVFKNIVLIQKYSDALAKQGERTKLETFGLKKSKNEFTGAFKKSPSAILNFTFLSKFEFKEINLKKNW